MDIFAILGLVIGIFGLMFGYLIEAKFNFGAYMGLLVAPAACIVFGGTAGAILLAFPMEDLKKMKIGFGLIFKLKEFNEIDIINKLAELSEKARKDGLLSLEQDAQTSDNALIRKGLALVVDGIETDVIKDILEREVELHESIYETCAKILEAAGGYSPAMGVCGTVMGMVTILGNMGGDTNALAHSIAVAFVATFYGVAFANCIYLPMAGRVKAKAEREKMVSDLVVEGLLSIQAGENPRIIKEKLNLALLEELAGKPSSKDANKDDGE